jgi:energy-coupling factor transporter ATP-binding protein EcfA2
MRPADPTLVLDDVSVDFPRREGAALRDVSLRLGPGEQVMVIGASGAGKSTLLQTITGVIPHSIVATLTGTVEIGGNPTIDSTVVELSRHVGVLAQDPGSGICLPDVEQELALPLENRAVDPREISARIDRALASVNAAALRRRQTGKLSGGEGQRVALAASLIAEPALLLLDEPTSMLDAAGVTAVRAAIASAMRTYGPAVVLVEHRVDDFAGPAGVSGLPQRAIVLGNSGQVLADGPTAEVLEANAGPLNSAGCWLPLETELIAVTGRSGGLGSAAVRAAVRGFSARAGSEPDVAASDVSPKSGETVLAAESLVISRSAPQAHKRRRSAPGADQEPAILHDVTLQLRRGEIVALLGANGTGKTSLLLSLAGLLAPAAGTVSGGRPGMVFQNPEHQFVAYTVRDEIRHGLAGIPDEQVGVLLERHRLTHLAEQSPFRLSGGEKRRLSVAAMLAHHRPALLADEPTFGLDRRDTIATITALKEAAAQGRGILFSCHDLRTVATLAHRAVVIADRTIIADGPVFEVLRGTAVLERAGLTVPPLVAWLLTEFGSAQDIRRVLTRLDAAVAGKRAPQPMSGGHA